jgi:putative membrane protein
VSAPLLSSLFVSHWDPSLSLNVELSAAGGVYLGAAAKLAGRWPLRRTASFLGGLGTLAVALESGLDSYDAQLLSVHMAQHMLLLLLAPLLLLSGRPVILALRVLPAGGRRRLLRLLPRLRPVAGPWRGLVVYALILSLTHLSWFYDQTLTHPLLHETEHALYLLAGTLLLWPLLDGDPVPSQRLGGLGKLGYMLISMLPMAVIGAYLNRHTSVVYTPYAGAGRALGISAVNDQATAGAIMWVIGNTTMVFVGLWTVVASMLREERRQQARDDRAAALIGEAFGGGGVA